MRLAAEACSLPFDWRCEGDACVALWEVPDLDGLGGWLEFTFQTPQLVQSVVLRDLGMPQDDCANAIQSMDARVLMVPTDQGEIWCAGADAALEEWCVRMTGLSGFAAGARELRF